MSNSATPDSIADALATGRIEGAQSRFNQRTGQYEYMLNHPKGFIVYGTGPSREEAAADALRRTSKPKPKAEWKDDGDKPPRTNKK